MVEKPERKVQHKSRLFWRLVALLLIASVTASYQIEDAIATSATQWDYMVHRARWAGDTIPAVFV